MTDRDGLLVRAAALAFLAKRVEKAQQEVRAEITKFLRPGDHQGAYLSNGTHVGGVTVSARYWRAKVDDPAAFLAWVQENRPDEIVPAVRESYQGAVLNECKSARAAVTSLGEFVPGVRVYESSGAYTASYEPDETAGLLDAVRANALLAIEAP